MDDDLLPVAVRGAGAGEPPMPALYVDIASPECLLSAERVLSLMPVAVQWIPVHLSPPALTDDERAAIAATVEERNLQPLRWPPPFDAERANLTATYAKSIGKGVGFVQAALRQAYAGGRDLSVEDHLVIAASACEMHPRAVLTAIRTRGVRAALEAATALARERGVQRTPAVWIPPVGRDGARVLHGDARLPDAAALVAEQTV